MGDDLVPHNRISMVYSAGVYTDYPYQANTFGLPAPIIAENLLGYLKAREAELARTDHTPPKNFAEWVARYLGEGFEKNFMRPYNRKLWRAELEEISCTWCDRFVPKPTLDAVIRGALGLSDQRMGYNAHFLYPREGGIARLPQAIARALPHDIAAAMRLNTRVVAIDTSARTVTTSAGDTLNYDILINTAALNRFVALCSDAPAAVRDDAAKLRATDVAYVNAALTRFNAPRCHWFYVPEERFIVHRVGCYTHIDPAFSPPDTFACYVERSIAGHEADATIRDEAIADLAAIGVIDSPRDVLFADVRRIANAYVVHDHAYDTARPAIHAWLNTQNILSIGRWGDWNYSAMEDALIDGTLAAQKITAGFGQHA